MPYSADWGPPVCAVPKHEGMKTHSGQNHDNKIAPQVSFNPTAANIMDLLHIFVITKQYFFQRFSNYQFSTMSYFCFHYTNTFFIHTMNYFWVVRRIIFLMCIENYFFILPIIIFRGIHGEFIFGPTMLCGPCSWSGLVRNFDFLGRPIWKLSKWRSAFKENAKA